MDRTRSTDSLFAARDLRQRNPQSARTYSKIFADGVCSSQSTSTESAKSSNNLDRAIHHEHNYYNTATPLKKLSNSTQESLRLTYFGSFSYRKLFRRPYISPVSRILRGLPIRGAPISDSFLGEYPTGIPQEGIPREDIPRKVSHRRVSHRTLSCRNLEHTLGYMSRPRSGHLTELVDLPRMQNESSPRTSNERHKPTISIHRRELRPAQESLHFVTTRRTLCVGPVLYMDTACYWAQKVEGTADAAVAVRLNLHDCVSFAEPSGSHGKQAIRKTTHVGRTATGE